MHAPIGSDRQQGRRRWIDAADGVVLSLHRHGFLQSLIFHVALLLVMALTVIESARPANSVRLAVSFDPATDVPVDVQDVVMEADTFPQMAEADPLLADAPLPAEAWDDPVGQPLPTLDLAEAEVVDLDTNVRLAGVDMDEMLAEASGPIRLAGLSAATTPRGEGTGSGDGNGGFGGELGRRLKAAGARTGDVQVSIAWDNFNDIDVHVMVESISPRRGISMINFSHPRGACGGWLDVDQNVVPMTPAAVENVFWPHSAAPYGRFTVYVHHYRNWGGANPTQVHVAVLVDGRQSHHTATVHAGSGPVVVTSFVRQPHDKAARPIDDFDDASGPPSPP